MPMLKLNEIEAARLGSKYNMLNVNGRKIFRNNSKSIWNYNPDELRVIFIFILNQNIYLV